MDFLKSAVSGPKWQNSNREKYRVKSAKDILNGYINEYAQIDVTAAKEMHFISTASFICN